MADPNPTTPAAADQVIDFMREQFARVHQRFDKLELTLSEHGTRLQRVEREIVGLHQGMANMHSDYAILNRRLDRVSERLERIERRLPAPAPSP
jgi:chromosome segregation ATPase